jgi:hypothetical protein
MFRNQDISSHLIAQEYINSVSSNHCPFIIPSIKNEVMYFSEYSLGNLTFENLQKYIFYTGLIHTYAFRLNRITENEHKKRLLFCENIIFKIEENIDGEKLFAFPHWYLKLLFTEKSILFGKFWKGETATNKNGIDITVPPFHLLSIRSAIKPIDKRFFTLTPELEEFYLNSEDDNQNVFHFIKEKVAKNILVEMSNLDYNSKDNKYVLSFIDKLMDSELYFEIAKWAAKLENNMGIKNYSLSQLIQKDGI